MAERRIDKADMFLVLITKGLNDPRFVPGKSIVFTIDEIIQIIDNEYEHGLRCVVFCKDCVHYENESCFVIGWCNLKPDNYCSWGHKKEEHEDA